ncbi:MAG: DUF1016 N-terminal domain-containing protein [archaeon]|nr:DUF1016 N-terminal domain-containing protein [archaeon]
MLADRGKNSKRRIKAQREREDYGKKIIENLAYDLNFRRDELYRIVQFYNVYPIVVTVSRELSWSHYVEIIKVDEAEKMKWKMDFAKEVSLLKFEKIEEDEDSINIIYRPVLDSDRKEEFDLPENVDIDLIFA